MTDELMEQRMAELNAHHAEMAPACANEKRAYSVDDISSARRRRRRAARSAP